LIPTFSPQGDGNLDDPTIKLEIEVVVDPYLFPARGRKPGDGTSKCFSLHVVDPYLFPARGRKLHVQDVRVLVLQKLIPTFSPQGDGNGTRQSSGTCQS